MKYITLVLLLSYCSMNAMELPHDQQDKNNTRNQQYTILPADVCAKIAAYKTEIDGPAIQTQKVISMSCPSDWNILVRMSTTWNSLIPKSSPDRRYTMWEHQFRYHKNYAGGFNFRSVLHFDTITTGDFNTFIIDKQRREGEHQSIQFKAMFDGPNNDGGPGAGVVLFADSYFGERHRKTRFYLFKQHGIDSKDYSDAQEMATSDDSRPRRVYQGFPNRFKVPKDNQDYRSEGQYLDFCALAPYKRGIIASHSMYYVPYLHVFEYEHGADATNHAAPDQSFKVKMLASVREGPRFARLAWVYGRTLLGLTQDQQLYVVALDEHEGKTSIRFCRQKLGKKTTNFCLARPDNHHIVFLCDDQNNIYTANLKHRDRKGAIALNVLMCNGQKASNGLERVDRMWVYEEGLALMDTVSMKVLLFTLNQQNWNGPRVNTVLQAKKIVKVFPWMEEPYDEYHV
jgi:hypothetical protein